MNLTYSSAKQKIAYCSSNLIILRNFENLTECEVFGEHKSETSACRFNQSGTMICSGDIKGNVIIFETFSPFPIRKQIQNILSDKINDIAWTSDGQRIAVVGNGKQTFGKVFLLDTGSSVGEISAVSKMINCVDFRPQRPFRMWLGGEDFRVSYYEGPPFKFKKYIKDHKNFVNSVKFDPTGQIAITVSSDKTMFIGNGQTGEKIQEYQSEHTGSIMSCSFFQTQGTIFQFATASNDKTVRIWKLEENQIQSLCKLLPVGKANAIENMFVGIHVCLNNQKKEVVTAIDLAGRVCVWEQIENDKEPDFTAIGHQKGIKSMCYNNTSTSEMLVTADENSRICSIIFNLLYFVVLWQNKIAETISGKGHNESTSIIKIAPSLNWCYLYSIAKDGFVKKIDVQTKSFMADIKIEKLLLDMVPSKSSEQDFYILVENEIQFYQGTDNIKNIKNIQLDFTPTVFDITIKDEFFLVGSQAGEIFIIEASSGQIIKKLPMYGRKITSIAVSPNNKSFAAGDNNYKILLWNLSNYNVLTEMFCYHTGMITSLSYSQTGKYLLSTSIDCKACVWNCQSFSKELEILNLHKNGIFCGTFTQQGEAITGGGDNLIKIIEGNEPFL